MINYIEFKRTLEQACSIGIWSPSHSQLEQIANEVNRNRPSTANDLADIVRRECPGTLFQINEGVDNSDVRTLLALAIQMASAKRS